MEPDWSTPEGLAAIKEALAATIDGWSPPVAYAVGISPASSSPELEFPHVNAPGGTHGLPAVVLAKLLGHANGTQTYELSRAAARGGGGDPASRPRPAPPSTTPTSRPGAPSWPTSRPTRRARHTPSSSPTSTTRWSPRRTPPCAPCSDAAPGRGAALRTSMSIVSKASSTVSRTTSLEAASSGLTR